MLQPVSDIQSTAAELARLCRLFSQIKLDCDDANLAWKIAQLSSTAEEMNEQFMDEFRLWHLSYENEKLYATLLNDDKIEARLSAAFQSAAVLDSAVYKAFTPSATFINAVKFLRKQTLHLLHERRGLR